jgi:hypothetical protein
MTNYFSRLRDQTRILDLLSDLTPSQKQTIETRYIQQLKNYTRRCALYDHVFHISRITVLISSLVVPALLSVQCNKFGEDIYANAILWFTWILSLTVGILNGSLLLFRVEKKYYLLHIIKSQLEAEGIYYAALTGRYNGFLTPGRSPNHQNQYVFFIHAIERITMRETDVEYFCQYDNNMNIHLHNDIPQHIDVSSGSGRDSGRNTPVPENHINLSLQGGHASVNLYHPSPDQPIIPVEVAPPREE